MAVSRMVEVSENQRRAQDLVSTHDLVVRGVSVVALMLSSLLVLLAM